MTSWHPDLQPATERVALEQRLDWCRAEVVRRVDGLDDPAARSFPLPATSMSVAGIVKHLAWVEDRWFTGKLLGEPLPEPWASAPLGDEPDWPFTSAAGDAIDETVRLYLASCERSRAATARFDSLDDVAAQISFGDRPVSVRWLLIGVATETASHLGHLDVLRDALR